MSTFVPIIIWIVNTSFVFESQKFQNLVIHLVFSFGLIVDFKWQFLLQSMKHTRIVNENSHISFSVNQYFLYSFLGKIWIYNSRKTLSIRLWSISNFPDRFSFISFWFVFRWPIWDKTGLIWLINLFSQDLRNSMTH